MIIYYLFVLLVTLSCTATLYYYNQISLNTKKIYFYFIFWVFVISALLPAIVNITQPFLMLLITFVIAVTGGTLILSIAEKRQEDYSGDLPGDSEIPEDAFQLITNADAPFFTGNNKVLSERADGEEVIKPGFVDTTSRDETDNSKTQAQALFKKQDEEVTDEIISEDEEHVTGDFDGEELSYEESDISEEVVDDAGEPGAVINSDDEAEVDAETEIEAESEEPEEQKPEFFTESEESFKSGGEVEEAVLEESQDKENEDVTIRDFTGQDEEKKSLYGDDIIEESGYNDWIEAVDLEEEATNKDTLDEAEVEAYEDLINEKEETEEAEKEETGDEDEDDELKREEGEETEKAEKEETGDEDEDDELKREEVEEKEHIEAEDKTAPEQGNNKNEYKPEPDEEDAVTEEAEEGPEDRKEVISSLSEKDLSVNDLIDLSEESKKANDLILAVEYLYAAFAKTDSVDIKNILCANIVSLYKEIGKYNEARLFIESFLEDSSDSLNSSTTDHYNQLIVYLDSLDKLLTKAGQEGLPFSRVPKIIKIMSEKALKSK